MIKTIAELPTAFQSVKDTIATTPILQVVLIFAGMFIAQKIVDVMSNSYFERAYLAQAKKNRISISKKRFETLSQAFRKIASIIIWLIGVFAIISVTPLQHYLAAIFASAGIIGIAIGIAGKDIIMDLYVGMMALFEDQYRIGDVITIDQDHAGVVEDISLRTVKLRDIDGALHVVPHSMARAIINKTYGYANVNVELGASYDADIDKVKLLIDKVGKKMADDPQWKGQFIEPITYQTMLRFDESQLTVRALGKVKPGKQWDIASEFRERIKESFDKNNIEIPLPQRVVRTINEDAKKTSKK